MLTFSYKRFCFHAHVQCWRAERETVTYMDFGCRGEAVTDRLLGQTDKNTHTHIESALDYERSW